MKLPKPVTPSDAQLVWASLPNPSARRVALALSQAGRPVHHGTIARWRAQGWQTRGDSLHPLVAASQALDIAVGVLTGDPIAGAEAVRGKTVKREELEGLPDHEALNRLVRQTYVTNLLIHDVLVPALPRLLAQKPRETAVLIKALAETLRAVSSASVEVDNARKHAERPNR